MAMNMPATDPPATDLAALYRAYIACLNARDWDALGRHVHPQVTHNGQPLGLPGYRQMLEGDVAAIPDLHFDLRLLICEPPHIAAMLHFDCTPRGDLFGLPVNGRHVRFGENAFYEYRDGLILNVHSVIDKAALAAQL